MGGKNFTRRMAQRNLKSAAHGAQQDVEVEKKGEYFDVLTTSFVRGFSEGLQRKFRRLRIGFVPKREETMYTNL